MDVVLSRPRVLRSVFYSLEITEVSQLARVSKLFRDVAYMPCFLGARGFRAPPRAYVTNYRRDFQTKAKPKDGEISETLEQLILEQARQCAWKLWSNDCISLRDEAWDVLVDKTFKSGDGYIWAWGKHAMDASAVAAGLAVVVKGRALLIPGKVSAASAACDLAAGASSFTKMAAGVSLLEKGIAGAKLVGLVSVIRLSRAFGTFPGNLAGSAAAYTALGFNAVFQRWRLDKWRQALEPAINRVMESRAEFAQYICIFSGRLLEDPVEQDGKYYERMELEMRNIPTENIVSDYRMKAAILGSKRVLLKEIQLSWNREWFDDPTNLNKKRPSMSDMLAESSRALKFNLDSWVKFIKPKALSEVIEVYAGDDDELKSGLTKQLEIAIKGKVVVSFITLKDLKDGSGKKKLKDWLATHCDGQ